MSRFAFEIPSPEQAHAMLAMTNRQAEFYPDRVSATRRLQKVTSFAERLELREYVAASTFACSGCNGFAFERPTLCYWCRAHQGEHRAR